jgi:hypothetical protein
MSLSNYANTILYTIERELCGNNTLSSIDEIVYRILGESRYYEYEGKNKDRDFVNTIDSIFVCAD